MNDAASESGADATAASSCDSSDANRSPSLSTSSNDNSAYLEVYGANRHLPEMAFNLF